jgi:hypothetical protein
MAIAAIANRGVEQAETRGMLRENCMKAFERAISANLADGEATTNPRMRRRLAPALRLGLNGPSEISSGNP